MFFRYDHTSICFKDGHSKGDNFGYATTIPFDIDNSHSDNPEDWITPDAIASRLKGLGISFWMAGSRNHQLSKTKNGVVQSARPRFHVYLLLSVLLYDSDKFVLLCEWCIGTFNSDPQVKSNQVPYLPEGWRAERDGSINCPAGYAACEIVSPVLKGAEGIAEVVRVIEILNANPKENFTMKIIIKSKNESAHIHPYAVRGSNGEQSLRYPFLRIIGLCVPHCTRRILRRNAKAGSYGNSPLN